MAKTHNRKKIFLSYSHVNKDIADRIDGDFQAIGIPFQRDVRDVRLGGSFKIFMNSIAKSDLVIVLVSKEYLRSRACMYEAMEVLNTHEFESRIIPILLDNAMDIYKPNVRKKLYDYWQKELTLILEKLQQHGNEDFLQVKREVMHITEYIPQILQKILDMNGIPFESLKAQFYKPLLDIVGFTDKYLVARLIEATTIEDNEERELALEKFLQEFPGNELALFQKAFACERQGLYIKARDYYEQVRAINPMNFEVYNNLGIIFARKLKEYDKAREYLKKAIQMAPLYLNPYYNLAYLLEDHFSDFDGARRCYEKILQYNPDDALTHFNLGTLLEKGYSDHEGARQHLERAVDIDPDLANAHRKLASLYDSAEDYQNARVHLEKAIAIDPDDFLSHFQLGMLLWMQFKEMEEGIRHVQVAMKGAPDLSEKFSHLFQNNSDGPDGSGPLQSPEIDL